MLSEEQYLRIVNRLRAGAAVSACGTRLARMEQLERLKLHSKLMFERLEYKQRTLTEIFDHAGGNWNMTLFVLFMRTLGDASNREAFMRLAWRVTYNPVLQERLTPLAVEAMMIGASGLLEHYPADDYTRRLAGEFAHLSRKYSIEPMSADEWNLHRIKPLNHPILRLAQAAALFTAHEFIFSSTVGCRTAADVKRIFGIEAPDYWTTHFTPGVAGGDCPKRIGHTKSSLIGINLVAPLQFAYGRATGSEQMRGRAMELLESIEAEDNRYMRRWEASGVVPSNAFDSQALLQLSTSYCEPRRCEECPVGRLILREAGSEGTAAAGDRLRSW